MLLAVETQIELSRALRRSRRPRGRRTLRGRELPPLVAESRAMQPVLHLIERVAPSDASVSHRRARHRQGVVAPASRLSRRSGRPFVAVNAGGWPTGCSSRSVFGHVKGAFTDAQTDRIGCFELADGGTLFLDEIATMPIGQQSKLLRALQSGEFHAVGSSKLRKVEVRLLAATNADIPREVTGGRFREDLLYRLNTSRSTCAPAERRRTSPPSPASPGRAGGRYGETAPELSPAALQALLEHNWPATCASSSTSSSGPACWRAGRTSRRSTGLLAAPRRSRCRSRTPPSTRRSATFQRALGARRQRQRRGARARAVALGAVRRLQHYGLKAWDEEAGRQEAAPAPPRRPGRFSRSARAATGRDHRARLV